MDNSLLIQKQIKDNAEDLHNYVRDLKLWEEEMKRKDRQLSGEPTEEALPPVRRAKLPTKSQDKKEEKIKSAKKRLTSYDYSSWDKFDVEKACEEVDNEDNKNKDSQENNEEPAAQEEKYLKEKALYEKELGNKHVKASKWDEAIDCYTKAIEAYPKDPIFFANRALCYLKKKNYAMVESDCTASLKLDPTYVKAMLRRAAGREALGRAEDARLDLRNALRLEPNNGQALRDLERLGRTTNKSTTISSCETVSKESTSQTASVKEESKKTTLPPSSLGNKIKEESSQVEEPEWTPCNNTIEPIVKPPHLRSKKPLKRIQIYDVGPNASQHSCVRKTQNTQNFIPTSQIPAAVVTSREEAAVASPGSSGKPRSILTMASAAADVPPPPSTSVQFHTSWSCIKANPELRYRFLKQIPGENLPEIFKESLESGMFSNILATLASEFTANGEPVLSYLQGLTRVKRFSTLALFMSSSDKSNLMKLFDHCLKEEECSSEDIDSLRRLYEIS